MIKSIKSFFSTDFKDRYYRCECGKLLSDADFLTGSHLGHKSKYALYISFTEFIWVRFIELKKYTWRNLCKI